MALVLEEPVCTILDCFYIDRRHKRANSGRYTNKPLKLRTLSFPITELLSVIGKEICCDFTHMLVTDGTGIDIDANTTPLCGSL